MLEAAGDPTELSLVRILMPRLQGSQVPEVSPSTVAVGGCSEAACASNPAQTEERPPA